MKLKDLISPTQIDYSSAHTNPRFRILGGFDDDTVRKILRLSRRHGYWTSFTAEGLLGFYDATFTADELAQRLDRLVDIHEILNRTSGKQYVINEKFFRRLIWLVPED